MMVPFFIVNHDGPNLTKISLQPVHMHELFFMDTKMIRLINRDLVSKIAITLIYLNIRYVFIMLIKERLFKQNKQNRITYKMKIIVTSFLF